MQQAPRDLVRTTLGVLAIGGLIMAVFWILRPFLAATIWATMIVVATWPLMLWFESRLWGRRSLAVGVMTLLLLLLFVAPLMLAIAAIVKHSAAIVDAAKMVIHFRMPPPPDWLSGIPFVGEMARDAWLQLGSIRAQDVVSQVMPYADDIARWSVSQAGSLGALLVQFLLVVVLSALMYAGGEAAARAVRRFGERLAGHYGVTAVTLGGQAIRGVALGVGITAVVQAGIGGIGLAIAGVPLAGPLTALMLMLCIAQIGPFVVLIPAIAWVYWSGDMFYGTVLLVFGSVAMTIDNIIRPALIRRGADLPLLLIFAGVIGGLLAFGLVGIFIGPVVLAVAYTLVDAWISDGGALGKTADDA
ncbi:MAG TPA: AI-2E family transporter YdiK [Burkholderiaceae bacterium]|jgi:predicted PurR-regulated permease PerM|nr:AI-2E family transporter YdiK [Burkholderiaceae bacterium]